MPGADYYNQTRAIQKSMLSLELWGLMHLNTQKEIPSERENAAGEGARMIQLLLHLWGDYVLQSDWMAQNKTKAWLPATVHALLYSAPFVLLRPSFRAWLVIFGTHLLIDRFRLARYVVWAKNWMGASKPWFNTANGWTDKDEGTDYRAGTWPTPPFSACAATGYPPTTPVWMAVWLMIIADNVLHLTINYLSLRFL